MFKTLISSPALKNAFRQQLLKGMPCLQALNNNQNYNFCRVTKQNEKKENQFQQFDKNSTAFQVQESVGLQRFLNQMYSTTFLSVSGILGGSLLLASLQVSTSLALFGGLGLSIGGIIGMNFTNQQIQEVNYKGQRVYTSINSSNRILSYTLACLGLSLSLSPFIGYHMLINPYILPTGILITSSICGISSLYAYMRPSGSLLYLKGPLTGALLGLIVLQLTSGLGAYFYGAGTFYQLAHSIDLYVGIGLFTAFVAYDTHEAIEMYKQGIPDHLKCSLNLVLNFINLLVRIMEIISGRDN